MAAKSGIGGENKAENCDARLISGGGEAEMTRRRKRRWRIWRSNVA
jgi:hypothetical protein